MKLAHKEYIVITNRGERLEMTADYLQLAIETLGVEEFKKQAIAVLGKGEKICWKRLQPQNF